VVDLQETPAVPPTPSGGDDRMGTLIAGAILIFLGLDVAIAANLVLHVVAGPGGMTLGWMRITSTLGPYAEAVLGLGIVATAVGFGMILVGRTLPRGPFVLPGVDY
jgi:hypothetical protein